MSIDYQALMDCAKTNQNVLLIGKHGVGKTVVTRKIFEDMGLKLKYYSASTIDPWADLVGIPIPIDVTNGTVHKELQFIRPRAVDDAEVIFMDELNRAAPRVLNAVLELIQFRSINGEKLPKLKMVWAAINPPGGVYQVNDLDPALADRFQVHMEIKADPSKEFLTEACGDARTVDLVLDWWNGLDVKLRDSITPRRLEYLCRSAKLGIPLSLFVPFGIKVPVAKLEASLSGRKQVTFDNLKVDLPFRMAVIEKLQSGNVEVQAAVTTAISGRSFHEVSVLVDVVRALPKEVRARVFNSPMGQAIATYIRNSSSMGVTKASNRPDIKELVDLYNEYSNTSKESTKVAVETPF